MKTVLSGITGLAFFVVTAAAGEVGLRSVDAKINVVVSILPYKDFVEAVGDGRVNVSVMVPPGASPHHYDSKPSQLKALSKADSYVKVGMPIEFEISWIPKLEALNKKMIVVDASRGISGMSPCEEAGAGSVPKDTRHRGAVDPHVWVSLRLAAVQVENICRGLVSVDPAHREFYEANKAVYLQKLNDAHRRLEKLFSSLKNREFFVIHPFLEYFAKDYGLRQVCISSDGHSLSVRKLKEVFDPKKGASKVLVVPAHERPREADVIAHEAGAKLLVVDAFPSSYIESIEAMGKELYARLNAHVENQR